MSAQLLFAVCLVSTVAATAAGGGCADGVLQAELSVAEAELGVAKAELKVAQAETMAAFPKLVAEGSAKAPAQTANALVEPSNQISLTETFHVDVTKDVIYGQALQCSGPELPQSDCSVKPLRLDVYSPRRQGSAGERMVPALVIAHGGGYLGGSKNDGEYVGMAEFWAKRGFVVFNIDYRKVNDYGKLPADAGALVSQVQEKGGPDGGGFWAPQFGTAYPATRDYRAAIRFVRASAQEYGIDPNRVVAAGASAGGASALAATVLPEQAFRDELSDEDFTLSSTHLNQSSVPNAAVIYWSTNRVITLYHQYRSTVEDSASAPVFFAHGTIDDTCPYDEVVATRPKFPLAELLTIEGCGHRPWCWDGNGKFGCEGSGSSYGNEKLDGAALKFVADKLHLTLESAWH